MDCVTAHAHQSRMGGKGDDIFQQRSTQFPVSYTETLLRFDSNKIYVTDNFFCFLSMFVIVFCYLFGGIFIVYLQVSFCLSWLVI